MMKDNKRLGVNEGLMRGRGSPLSSGYPQFGCLYSIYAKGLQVFYLHVNLRMTLLSRLSTEFPKPKKDA